MMRRFIPILAVFIVAAVAIFQGCSITNPLDNFQLILDVPVEEQIIAHETRAAEPDSQVLRSGEHLTNNTTAKATALEVETNVSGLVRIVGVFENVGTGSATVLVHSGPAGVGPSTLLGSITLASPGDIGTVDVDTTLSATESIFLSALGDSVDVLVQSLTLHLPADVVILEDVSVSDLEDYEITNVSHTEITGTLTNHSSVAIDAFLLFNTSAAMNREEHSIFETTIGASGTFDFSTADPDTSGVNTAIKNKQDLYFEVWLVATDLTSSVSVQIDSLAFNATVRASTGL